MKTKPMSQKTNINCLCLIFCHNNEHHEKVSVTAFPATCIYCRVFALRHHATRMNYSYYRGTHAINMYINRSFVFVIRFLMILVQSVEKYSKINYTITFAIDFKLL